MKTLSAPSSSTLGPGSPVERWQLSVQGRVQGVGFRPFVWQLATALGLQGQVANDLQGARVEIQGPPAQLQRFSERLGRELPLPGLVQGLSVAKVPTALGSGFNILASHSQGPFSAQVLPDLDVCPDCLRELFDPVDRRYRYPFLNCTHCGPRYSVILDLPYDRERSTLRGFPLCPQCQAEYDDPADRRYHAQPVACPRCGPRLWFAQADGSLVDGDPLARAEALLREGGLVAIKGPGRLPPGLPRRRRSRGGAPAQPQGPRSQAPGRDGGGPGRGPGLCPRGRGRRSRPQLPGAAHRAAAQARRRPPGPGRGAGHGAVGPDAAGHAPAAPAAAGLGGSPW